jgi:hypothetical protein
MPSNATSWNVLADAAGPHLAVAFVIRPEMIDPQKLARWSRKTATQ